MTTSGPTCPPDPATPRCRSHTSTVRQEAPSSLLRTTLCSAARVDFLYPQVRRNCRSLAICSICHQRSNGSHTWNGARNAVCSVYYTVAEQVPNCMRSDSDILHLDVAGTSIIVLSSTEAAEELLVKRAAIYSDRRVVRDSLFRD